MATVHLPNRLELGAAIAALLLASGAHAQRRVIAPGAPPPAAEEPKPAAAQPAPEKEKAAEAEKPAQPAPQPQAAPAAQKPAPTPPAPPKLLVPKEETEAKKAATAAAAAPADPAKDAVYRKRVEKHAFSMRVSPGQPVPGQAVTLVFEIARVLEIPDPATGDRAPMDGETFFATIQREGPLPPAPVAAPRNAKGKPAANVDPWADALGTGKDLAPADAPPREVWDGFYSVRAPAAGGATTYRLHALADPGTYGLHFTPVAAGLYRVTVAQKLAKAGIGDKPLTFEFELGVGQPTPMAKSDDEPQVSVRKARSTLRTTGAAQRALLEAMKPLGESWMALLLAMQQLAPAPALEAAAKAAAEQAAKVAGKAPDAAAAKEFDALAGELAKAAAALPVPAMAGDRLALERAVARAESEGCARCHARYRFKVADDVAGWPRFIQAGKAPAPTR